MTEENSGGLEQAIIDELDMPLGLEEDSRPLYRIREDLNDITEVRIPNQPDTPVYERVNITSARKQQPKVFPIYPSFRMVHVLHYALQGGRSQRKKWFVEGAKKKYGQDAEDFIAVYTHYNPENWYAKEPKVSSRPKPPPQPAAVPSPPESRLEQESPLERITGVDSHFLTLGMLSPASGLDRMEIKELARTGQIDHEPTGFGTYDAIGLYNHLLGERRQSNARQLFDYLVSESIVNPPS